MYNDNFILYVNLLDGLSINRISRVAASTASPRTSSSILNTNSYQSSRRNSVDSLDESSPNFRDFRVCLSCYLINLKHFNFVFNY